MRTMPRAVLAVLALTLASAPAAEARVRVVTSLPDLRALTEAVGGDLVEVESLARGNQNAHDIELRPSLMVRLRRADVLVVNGLELDHWVDGLARGSQNARVMAGAPGRVEAWRGVEVRGVPPGRVDRSMGDVHPLGNPHYTLDPDTAPAVTANIVEGLARAAPEHRATFEARRRAFLERLRQARERWAAALAPLRGTRVVVNHDAWIYLLARFGLVQAGTIEDRPGIPPSAAHLARLIAAMRAEGVRAVIVEPWGDRRTAERVAAEAGARVVVLAHAVGALPGTGTYLDFLEHNVSALVQALR
jgi:zinc/manganese transport system substrate-binding protein